MRVSAKADYALRAGVELAAAAGEGPSRATASRSRRGSRSSSSRTSCSTCATRDSCRASVARRAATGSRGLAEISPADVIRAVEGPIANVRGVRPEQVGVRRSGRSAPGRLDRAAGEHARRPGRSQPRGPRRRRPPGGRRAADERPGCSAAALGGAEPVRRVLEHKRRARPCMRLRAAFLAAAWPPLRPASLLLRRGTALLGATAGARLAAAARGARRVGDPRRPLLRHSLVLQRLVLLLVLSRSHACSASESSVSLTGHVFPAPRRGNAQSTVSVCDFRWRGPGPPAQKRKRWNR